MARQATRWLKRLTDGAVDLLFPPECLSCQRDLDELPDRIAICHACRGQIVRPNGPMCRRCAARAPDMGGDVDECAHCRDHRLWFDRAFALGDYTDLLRELAMAMKTDRSERLAGALARLIALQLGDAIRAVGPDAIVPVPMHAWRRFARGTNSPAALAATLSRELKLPAYAGLLGQRRNVQPQIGLTQPARFRNVRGEMQTRKSYSLQAPHVLLIDDILTTGATCSEAARTLKRAGAAQVSVLVVARTPLE